MRRLVISGVAVFLVLAAVFLVARYAEPTAPDSLKMKIAASFYIPAEFVRQIGEDRVEVVSITPSGVEPHEYEPTPKEISDIYSAKLFIFQGGGFDSWAERLSDNLRSRGPAIVSIIDDLALENNDPHIWLDPTLAQREIGIIRDALIKIDPAGTAFYQENSSEYISALTVLDEEYKKGLAECGKKDFIASHSAFEYLAERYGLSLHPIVGLSPEEEPSPGKIAEIIELVRARNIKFIFTEPMAGSRAARTIARETGVEILTLNPIERLAAQDIASGKDYVSLMEDNLQNLKIALQCE